MFCSVCTQNGHTASLRSLLRPHRNGTKRCVVSLTCLSRNFVHYLADNNAPSMGNYGRETERKGMLFLFSPCRFASVALLTQLLELVSRSKRMISDGDDVCVSQDNYGNYLLEGREEDKNAHSTTHLYCIAPRSRDDGGGGGTTSHQLICIAHVSGCSLPLRLSASTIWITIRRRRRVVVGSVEEARAEAKKGLQFEPLFVLRRSLRTPPLTSSSSSAITVIFI